MPRGVSTGDRDIFGYLARAFDSLEERPLGDVDSLVLSCLSYYRLPREAHAARTHCGMPLRDLFRAEWFREMTLDQWDPDGLVRLLAAVVASPRLRDVRVCDYVDDFDVEAEKQFSAMTLRLPSGDAYVSFRGTDNTLVGWKEDFDMAFETRVPSQLAARAYLERVAPTIGGGIYLGGHSKGGNLAVFALSTCSDRVARRVRRAFSHDGPGFTAETLDATRREGRSHLVSKTVPQSSLIGMLFEQQEDYSVVASSTSGLTQHNPFSWVVEGTDFVRLESIGRGAGFLDDGLNQWISSMTRAERAGAVNALFSVLYASGKDTFADLSGDWQSSVPAMLSELAKLDPVERAHLVHAFGRLFQAFAPGTTPPAQEPRALLPG